MGRELELKFELSKADMRRLADEPPFGGLGVGVPHQKKLRSVYFDTPKHTLRAAGFALRLRRENGGWLQTVKADQRVVNGVSNPVELEATVPGMKPDLTRITDKKLGRAIEKVVKHAALRPVFETIVKRTTRKIQGHGSEIELAIDEGEVRAGKSSRHLCEVELELKAGGVAGLLLAAEELLAGMEIKLSSDSKAERGYRLALGKAGAKARRNTDRAKAIKRADTCATAFSTILASVTQQISVNRRTVLESDDPGGVHQLRIGLRRLRSALHALRSLVGRSSLRAFERSVREVSRSVGTLRDADVLMSGIVAPVAATANDKAGFAELDGALAKNRQAKRDEVRAALRGSAWTRLQLYLTLWPSVLEASRGVDRPIKKHARKVLRKDWRKSAKYGRHLDRLEVEQRHEKDVFGYINDARLAPQLTEIQRAAQTGADAAKAAGYIVGSHDAEAPHVWRTAGAEWRKLKRSPRFWA